MSWPPSGVSACNTDVTSYADKAFHSPSGTCLHTHTQVLRRVAAWEGHSDTIFALAYDASRRRLISGAKDSQVCR